jgi:Uma2 family endonuclease
MGKLIERPDRGHFQEGRIPPLQAGDRLTREEFERRYDAMPHLKKAELVEGVVYLPSPASAERHGRPQARLCTWLGVYQASTPGLAAGVESTVRLDWDNEPQPDASLRVLPSYGGQSRVSPEGYIEGAPELAAEIAASSASYDLHQKLEAYRRNGVREYLVHRVNDGELDWFKLVGGRYERVPPDGEGIQRSETFPGLWLDSRALLSGDLARVLAVLKEGLDTPEHAAFARRLADAARPAR